MPISNALAIDVPPFYTGPDREQRLLEGAKREGQLNIYSSMTAPDLDAVTDAFQKKYGIKVNAWRAGSEKVLQRAVTEARGGRNEMDIVETNMGPQRSSTFKNVPTIAEEGFSNLEVGVWFGLLAPAGTPAPIVAKLNSEINTSLQAEDVKGALNQQGMLPMGGPPDRFAQLIKSELERWPRVVAEARIKAD